MLRASTVLRYFLGQGFLHFVALAGEASRSDADPNALLKGALSLAFPAINLVEFFMRHDAPISPDAAVKRLRRLCPQSPSRIQQPAPIRTIQDNVPLAARLRRLTSSRQEEY